MRAGADPGVSFSADYSLQARTRGNVLGRAALAVRPAWAVTRRERRESRACRPNERQSCHRLR